MSRAGRFAPSPTGELHLGNLRTALVAWLSARQQGFDFVVRMEDLDRTTSSPAHATAQLEALATLGLDWDGVVVYQSDRFALYDDAIATLAADGVVYECFCTRREIQEAVRAPQGALLADGAYPGTCRNLTAAARRAHLAAGRRPALRLAAGEVVVAITDDLHGLVSGLVDDVVLRRNDGVPAYNLAVVVDDAAQSVAEVVRGDDLLSSTPRQVHLQRLLGVPTPRYRHVPLVVGRDGVRLAKRHGDVTLAQLAARASGPGDVVALLAGSLGLPQCRLDGSPVSTARDLLAEFAIERVPRDPWQLPTDLQRSQP